MKKFLDIVGLEQVWRAILRKTGPVAEDPTIMAEVGKNASAISTLQGQVNTLNTRIGQMQQTINNINTTLNEINNSKVEIGNITNLVNPS